MGVGIFVKKIPAVITGQEHTMACGTTEASPNVTLSDTALQGKTLFMSRCASCHVLFKNMTGPDLVGFTKREPWTDRNNVYDWIRNPAAFMQKNEYAKQLKEAYNGTMMTAFPDMTNGEIDAICSYVKEAEQLYYFEPLPANQ